MDSPNRPSDNHINWQQSAILFVFIPIFLIAYLNGHFVIAYTAIVGVVCYRLYLELRGYDWNLKADYEVHKRRQVPSLSTFIFSMTFMLLNWGEWPLVFSLISVLMVEVIIDFINKKKKPVGFAVVGDNLFWRHNDSTVERDLTKLYDIDLTFFEWKVEFRFSEGYNIEFHRLDYSHEDIKALIEYILPKSTDQRLWVSPKVIEKYGIILPEKNV